MSGKMLDKARDNAEKYNYKNVEFRQGDIEKRIPVEDDSADVVISNCVINLTSNKVNAFMEIHRILKPKGKGKMVISDLVTSKEMNKNSVNVNNWCSCIDGALTKEIMSMPQGKHDLPMLRCWMKNHTQRWKGMAEEEKLPVWL